MAEGQTAALRLPTATVRNGCERPREGDVGYLWYLLMGGAALETPREDVDRAQEPGPSVASLAVRPGTDREELWRDGRAGGHGGRRRQRPRAPRRARGSGPRGHPHAPLAGDGARPYAAGVRELELNVLAREARKG